MAFNIDKLMSGEYEPKKEELILPSLIHLFEDGDSPIFEVRGLTANEFSKSLSINDTHDTIEQVLTTLTDKKEVLASLQKTLGLGSKNDINDDLRKKAFVIECGLLSPNLESFQIGKLMEINVIAFYQIAQAIERLTGEGYDLKK